MAPLLYFILTGKPDYISLLLPGCICYSDTSTYKSKFRRTRDNQISVKPFGTKSKLDYEIDLKFLEEVSEKVAGLLLVLESDFERLKWFKEKHVLQFAETLENGSEVAVEQDGETAHGVVRFIGFLTPPKYPLPIAGMHFGIKVKGDWKKKLVDSFQTVFSKKECDMMVPFTKVRPWTADAPKSSAPLTTAPMETLEIGDKVTFVNLKSEKPRHGMLVGQGDGYYRISTDLDKNRGGGVLEVPFENVRKSTAPLMTAPMETLEIGDRVTFVNFKTEKPGRGMLVGQGDGYYRISADLDENGGGGVLEVPFENVRKSSAPLTTTLMETLEIGDRVTFVNFKTEKPRRGMLVGQGDGYYRISTDLDENGGGGVLEVPFENVRKSSAPLTTTPMETLEIGDRVTFVNFKTEKPRCGMLVGQGDGYYRISADLDENGGGGELEVPFEYVRKSDVPEEPEKMDLDPPANKLNSSLTVNTLVQISLKDRVVHGTIRWIGILPDKPEVMAGLELDEDITKNDGSFKHKVYFDCPWGRGIFVKLSACSADSRFQSIKDSSHDEPMPKEEEPVSMSEPDRLERVPPVSTDEVDRILVGQMKGIQGNCNSCYIDSTLFGLFSCSSALDSMLFKSTEAKNTAIQETLLHEIVNPLRSVGYVKAHHVMKLREQLQERGYSRSFTTEEKDPEEFLTIIMQDILAMEPLLKLSAGGKVQESHYYQIFLDQNQSLVLPTVQQLIDISFHTSGLRLTEVPSCLILQMPRFGKKFKMFEKIFPSLQLDVTDLLCGGPARCAICGDQAFVDCKDCSKDPLFGRGDFTKFCNVCTKQVHSHSMRSSHHPTDLDLPRNYLPRTSMSMLPRDRLELFAVLCIETSHYVSFIKHGPGIRDWIFFDSMADRKGESQGYNIPEVRPCPEVGAYLEMSAEELANEVPRDMKGVAKRLFCDAYMYLYQSPNMCLYR